MCNNEKCTQDLQAGQDDIHTVPGRVNYIVAKGYHHNNRLSFMQKTKQKVVVSNIRDETLRIIPTPMTINVQTTEVHRNRHALCDYTYTGSSGKQEVTIEISQILREFLIALHVT
jgi:hypothetical protein